MAKREKILMLVAALAALFGAFQLLRPAPSINQPEQMSTRIEGTKEFIEKVSAELQKQALTEAETYIVSKADVEWVGDPFLGEKLVPVLDANRFEPVEKQDLVYTGYINSGKRKLAIINGLEYEVGDHLVTGGFVVRSIEANAVVLESSVTARTISIPFVDE